MTWNTGDIITADDLNAWPARGEVTSGSSDASGDFDVTFPEAFSYVPLVFVDSTQALANGRLYAVIARTTTTFTVRAYTLSTGAPAASLAVRFMWVAF